MKPLNRFLLIFLLTLLLVLLAHFFQPQIINLFQPDNLAQVNLTQTRQVDLVEKKVNGTFNAKLSLPQGMEITVYADGLKDVRFLEFHNNALYASLPKEGKIVKLVDNNSDDKIDQVITVAEHLFYPHGIEFYNDKLFVAVQDGVVVLSDLAENGTFQKQEQIIKDVPIGGDHITRSIRIFKDKIYLSVGSSCNICIDDEKRAAILRYNLDGSHEEVCASGLRNSVGMTFVNGELFATENGADLLGDDFPQDEINKIECGKDYGWPSCHGNNVEDPKYGEGTCSEKEKPYISLQAHSAPLGLRTAPEDFPFQGLFVAYHSSWNRREPTGYKIVRISNFQTEPRVEDFITGWINGKWGRPVDITFNDGKMYISDDEGGRVYVVKAE